MHDLKKVETSLSYKKFSVIIVFAVLNK